MEGNSKVHGKAVLRSARNNNALKIREVMMSWEWFVAMLSAITLLYAIYKLLIEIANHLARISLWCDNNWVKFIKKIDEASA